MKPLFDHIPITTVGMCLALLCSCTLLEPVPFITPQNDNTADNAPPPHENSEYPQYLIHKVQNGETWQSLARLYAIPLKQLHQANSPVRHLTPPPPGYNMIIPTAPIIHAPPVKETP
jgi:LysM repeat protein